MRLWHIDLLSKLPRQQLLGQWRECTALIGNGFGKKHKTVDYVFKYSDKRLMKYASQVYDEMINRGYKPNIECVYNALIRRYRCDYDTAKELYSNCYNEKNYVEHDDKYMEECIENLKGKGIKIEL